MLKVANGLPTNLAWSSQPTSPHKITLDISVLTRPPSQALSIIALSDLAVQVNRGKSSSIDKRLKLLYKKKRISWQKDEGSDGSKDSLSRSHDSLLRRNNKSARGVGADQLFLFSSQPKIVSTTGPISPGNRKQYNLPESDSDSDIIPADWYSESPERLVPILLNRNQEKPGNQQNSTTTKLKTNVKAKVKVERRVKVNKNLKDKRKKESLGEEKVASEENDLKVERAHRSGILFSDYISELVVQDSSAAYPTIVFPEVLDDIYDFEIEKRVMQNQSKG
ncbi:uncharacterized protein LOC111695204 isoform X2 [Eurytemora carolleeae]|uniref:uncharacterized protein LOC111695204 isoform X2 n=1 Tax=Eurytemora carolleeae TaxID=1294199 RepID=UPI000C7909E8|nr:uncharacterized protein LOC111695204 isoform X2 [Eurytemora carolleeae]|eukprot:XP_023320198.1 uncharacterized protein LOC111695204 isoform X2 [Eurytemora affinis]